MKSLKLCCAATLIALGAVRAQELKVTGIRAECRDGQTFITWKDVAEGEDNARYRYRVYRSADPLTAANIDKAELCVKNVFNSSARLFGTAFRQADRVKPDGPVNILREGGDPLPPFSGLAVLTVVRDSKSYYAVVATENEKPVTAVVAGESATTEPADEKVAPIQPVKIHDSKTFGTYARVVQITGRTNLPLRVELHASNAQGGPAGDHGDYYIYFSRKEWGYREGMQGAFCLTEQEDPRSRDRVITLKSRDTIVQPSGMGPMETYWFGYVCAPEWAEGIEPKAYPFTERRMLWVIDWCIRKYAVDPDRVYCGGGSMGAWGTSTFALRHPEIFAAIYPNRPRTIQKGMPSLAKVGDRDKVMVDGENVAYFDRMNMVKFVSEHHEDLPFVGWCSGRHDGFASFREQIAMVNALTGAHHGFAFAWNNGDHSGGSAAMANVTRWYPQSLFARNLSYPAFGNSSINDDIGTGEEDVIEGQVAKSVMKDGNGAAEGGINLGFCWKDVIDEPDRWSVSISNGLAAADMTVDVTPRRCRQFKPRPGDTFRWKNTAAGEGEVKADEWGLVTVQAVVIKAGAPTTLSISRAGR